MLAAFIFALGVFVGNWLIVPLFFRGRNHYDGFWIGVIAGVLTFIFMSLAELFRRL